MSVSDWMEPEMVRMVRICWVVGSKALVLVTSMHDRHPCGDDLPVGVVGLVAPLVGGGAPQD
jgi:hypothetical protein